MTSSGLTLIGSRPDDKFFVVSGTVNDGLDCRPTEFVFIGIRNTKPWNHLKMCTFVLWTKIVAEFLYTIHPVIQVSDFVRLLLHV